MERVRGAGSGGGVFWGWLGVPGGRAGTARLKKPAGVLLFFPFFFLLPILSNFLLV